MNVKKPDLVCGSGFLFYRGCTCPFCAGRSDSSLWGGFANNCAWMLVPGMVCKSRLWVCDVSGVQVMVRVVHPYGVVFANYCEWTLVQGMMCKSRLWVCDVSGRQVMVRVIHPYLDAFANNSEWTLVPGMMCKLERGYHVGSQIECFFSQIKSKIPQVFFWLSQINSPWSESSSLGIEKWVINRVRKKSNYVIRGK